MPAATSAPADAAGLAATRNPALEHTIDQLIHRLDATLNDDGHLL
jgi:DUF1680 family protein